MAEMDKCTDCGTEVSRSAKSCPKCGKVLKRKKGCGRSILITLGILVGIGILSSIANTSGRTSGVRSTSNTSSSSSSAPVSQADRIDNALRNCDIHSVVIGSDLLSIDFNISDNLSSEMIVDGAKIDVMQILRALHDEGISYASVDITGRFSMRDRYGNSSIQDVVELRYSKESLDRINWSNFLWEDMYAIADDVWLHPAFQ
jgi:hypothetical protein